MLVLVRGERPIKVKSVKLRFKAWTIVKPFVLHYGKLLKIKMVMTLAPDSIKSPRH